APAEPQRTSVAATARRPERTGNGGRPASRPPARAVLPVQPPLFSSLGRGIVAVGRSPAILASAFLGLLLLWLLYSTTGVILGVAPGTLGQLQAIPPLHALLDSNLMSVSVQVFPPATTLALIAALVLLRAGLVSYWVSVLRVELARPDEDPETIGRPWSRAVWSFRTVLALEALYVLLFVALSLFIAQLLGFPGVMLLALGLTYFLAFATPAAVVEGAGTREALRLSTRAARARGPQHILLVFVLVFAVVALVVRFGGPTFAVTPSIPVWAYALGLTFLHVGVLATLVDRWMSLRDDVSASVAARSQTDRGRLAGSRLRSGGDAAE
ncbi:MAG TPA: hypothetical protein VF972_05355, partial [Actinomycetota bacterium]